MTLYEIQDLINNEVEFTIICETIEQRFDVTRSLLDLGVEHGTSGYSERVMNGSRSCEYMNPFIRYCHEGNIRIGYYSRGCSGGRKILYQNVAWTSSPELDAFDDDALRLLIT